MLVQALAAYADEYLGEQLGDVAFEEKPVRYWLEIDEQGRLLGVSEHVEIETRTMGGKKRTFERIETLKVPRSPVNRNTGIHPLLGCDSVHYVFGPRKGAWTAIGSHNKEKKHHEGFRELIKRAAIETKDTALQACAAFYQDSDALENASAMLADKKPGNAAMACLAVRPSSAAVLDQGGPVIERDAARRFWKDHYAAKIKERHAKGGEAMCLISGEHGPVAVTHDKVKGASDLGGQPAGVALMSFDKDAFASYGWKQNRNSPVSPERAAAYVMALNDLMKKGEHRRGWSKDVVLRTRTDYGGNAYLYWTRSPADEAIFDLFEQADPDDVAKLLDAPFKGERGGKMDDNKFYLLTVTGNGGRLVVRDFYHRSLKRVKENVRQWFEGLAIADVFNQGARASPPAVYTLLRTLSPPGVDPKDKKNAGNMDMLVRRALQGKPLGRKVLAAALSRLRRVQGGERLHTARIGLIRLAVNDLRDRAKEPEMTEKYDSENNDVAYLCGQLLAMYENLQYAAQGDTGTTVGDRYFSMASAYPLMAFTKLDNLSRAHLKRLRRDNRAAWSAIRRQLEEIMEKIQGNFPKQMTLEQQGRFVLGYHHRKAEQARTAKARSEAKAQSREEAV